MSEDKKKETKSLDDSFGGLKPLTAAQILSLIVSSGIDDGHAACGPCACGPCC